MTKNNPGEFDCYANAKDDEPMFVLLARDKAAPNTIRYWCHERVILGKNKADDPQIIEAQACAMQMEDYHYALRQREKQNRT
jgi:hypothetical protein